MPTPPTGTVTFLFSDIQGSTARWDRDRAAMQRALARHDAILRAAIESAAGYIFHTAGDAFGAAFASPDDAIAGAIAAQRALAAEDWPAITPAFEPLAVRMGLHTGLAELRDGDYFGPPLNRAARLMSAGHGGQVLLSLATQQLVRDRLPHGVTLRDLGAHRLKDLRFAEHIYQLVVAGLADVDAPPTTAEALPVRDRALVDADFLPAECPYRGLLAFRPEDARFFFGREAFTDRLTKDIAGRPMVGVIGPSGSGKSSVVFAGLLPRLAPSVESGEKMDRDGPGGTGWTVLSLRPGAEPFESLAAVLLPRLEPDLSETDRLVEIAKLAAALRDGALSVPKVVRRIHEKTGEGGRLLLVADQFEEIYTLCPDEPDQRRFQDLLFETLADGSGRDGPSVKLVLTLRADFMGHAMAYRPFSDALQDNNILLGPMNRAELTAAIVKPAELQGRAFESGLVERILADVGEEAGQLPLLEFALTKLWEGQQNGWLTHEAYEEIGRVEGAVARHADAVLDGLPPVEQDGCRRVFVQMVRPGEGTEDTRRLATKEELGEDWPLIRRLADARLVVTNRDVASGRETVEVVHEALIRSWGQLKGWMNADRAFRTWQERVRFAAKQWAATSEDEGALLRGVPLAEAEGWLAERGGELAPAERAYVEASVMQQARREAEEQARAERERAQQVRTLALERRGHRLVRIVAGVAVVGAIVAGGLAATARRSATEARSLAQASAAQAYLSSGDTGRALAVALEAVQVGDPPPQARRVLAEAAFAPGVRWEVRYPKSSINDVTVSPDGRMVAVALGAAISYDIKAPGLVLHDLPTGRLIRRFEGISVAVRSVAFSPDGRQLLSRADGGMATLWDVASGKPLRRMAQGRLLGSAAFIDGGERVVSLSWDGDTSQIALWDATSGRRLHEWTPGRFGMLGILPDGHRFVTSGLPSPGADPEVWIWRDGKRVQRLAGLDYFAMMADGDTLAVESPKNRSDVLVYSLAAGTLLRTLSVGGAVISNLASGANPDTLVSADYSGIIRFWDIGKGTETLRLPGHRSTVTALALADEDKALVSGSNDGSLRVWDLINGAETRRVKVGPSGLGMHLVENGAVAALASATDFRLVPVSGTTSSRRIAFPADWPKLAPFTADFTADGRLAAIGFGNVSAAISSTRIVDLATSQELPKAPRGSMGAIVVGLRFTRDGGQLVGIGWDGYLWVWNAADGTRRLTVNLNAALSSAATPAMLDVSPDGQLALVGLVDGRAVLISLATGQPGLVLTGHSERITAVGFSPDGHLAITGSNDRTAILWDVASGRALRRLEGHAGSVDRVAFGPDGQLVLTAGGDGTVRVWEAATGRQRQSQAIPVDGLAFLPDGTGYLTVSPDGFLRGWRLDDDPASVARWAFGHRLIPELSCGERRDLLIAAGCGADERFPTRTPYAVDGEETPSPSSPALSPTPTATLTGTVAMPTVTAQPGYTAHMGQNPGKLAASSAQAWTFEARAGTVLDVAAHADHPADAVDDAADQRAQGLLDTRLVIRDARGTILAEAEDSVTDSDTDAAAVNIVPLADGPLTFEVRSAADASAGPFSLDVTEVPLGTGARRLLEPDPNRLQGLVSPDGNTLLTREDEPDKDLRHVSFRSLADMTVRATFSFTHGLRPGRLNFSPDGRRLAANVEGGGGSVMVVDAAGGQVQRVIPAASCSIGAFNFIAGSRQLLTCGSDNQIHLWDLDTGAEVQHFAGHAGAVTQAVSSPDGQLVISSSLDHTLRVWDMASGRELRRYESPVDGFTGVELSPDSQTAAAMEGRGRTAAILLWSPATGAVIRRIPHPYICCGYGGRMSAFSPDGHRLFTMLGTGLHLWDVASGREASRLVGEAWWGRSTFSPDGKAVVALGVDGSVWWWDLAGLERGGR